jgi:hypothetical protein
MEPINIQSILGRTEPGNAHHIFEVLLAPEKDKDFWETPHPMP